MKIQVGKTYRDKFNRLWLIECELSRKGSFMGSTTGDRAGEMLFATFTGDGLREWMYNGKPVSNGSENNLLPNTIKKEGWIVVRMANSGQYAPNRHRAAPIVYDSLQQAEEFVAKKRGIDMGRLYTIVKMEYEVEE